MEILKFPHPHLLEKTEEVTVFGEELKTLLDAMWDTMSEHHGMGLAANQVGLSQRMFVMEGPDGKRFNFVNPVITSSSSAPANMREGCLSAPGDYVIVPDRAQWVQVNYEDEEGKSQSRVFQGIYAVCVQHEIDHLDGKAYLENKSIPKATRKPLASKWGLK
jgi:peptide deformylase